MAYIGNEYRKIVEIFTVQGRRFFGIDLDKTYFDVVANFWFEIDREDDLRRKEKHRDPIVGMGPLLDNLLFVALLPQLEETVS